LDYPNLSDLRIVVDLANRKGPKKGKKIPPTPGFELQASHRGHTQSSSRRNGFFSFNLKYLLLLILFFGL